MAELIEMPFGFMIQEGPGNHILDGGPDIPSERAIFGERRAHCKFGNFLPWAVQAEPIDLPFGLWTWVGWRKHKFSRIRQVPTLCLHGKAHWRHLANTIEPSVCGGNTVLCQITLTICIAFTATAYCSSKSSAVAEMGNRGHNSVGCHSSA